MRDADERVAGHGRQTEEGNWRPAGQVGENEQSHPFGHCGVRMRGKRLVLAADGPVHVTIHERNDQECQSIHHQQNELVDGVA